MAFRFIGFWGPPIGPHRPPCNLAEHSIQVLMNGVRRWPGEFTAARVAFQLTRSLLSPHCQLELNSRMETGMTVYALIELQITNLEGMGQYMQAVSGTIATHGGKYLVQAGKTELIEGDQGEYPLKVILEFPSMAAAKGWYNSPEYQEILPHRIQNSKGNFIWAEGV